MSDEPLRLATDDEIADTLSFALRFNAASVSIDEMAEAMMDAAEWIAAHYTVDTDREAQDVRVGEDAQRLVRDQDSLEALGGPTSPESASAL